MARLYSLSGGSSLRALIAGLAALVATSSLSGCYLLKQGAGQAQLLMSRTPVSKVMAEPTTPTETKDRLTLIDEAKAYAESVIGLKKTNNYQELVQLDRDAVSYVVSAAPKDQLEPYTWWFPIIGSVPYKGFFDRNDAVALQNELKSQGYDTILRGVPAFSTLGWLPDPVYSPFLKYDRATLANIVIHELTHVTLYLSGQASFNEGFATFVGNVGSQEFIERKYGPDSPEYKAARDAVADNAVFTEFIQTVSAKLDALYKSDRPREAKLADRDQIFTWAKQAFETQYEPRMKSHQFRHFPQGTFNNASLISYRTYYNRLDRFEAAYKKQGSDLAKTVVFFRDVVAKAKEPEKFLDEYLNEKL
jgi:predicted aminopeptidase